VTTRSNSACMARTALVTPQRSSRCIARALSDKVGVLDEGGRVEVLREALQAATHPGGKVVAVAQVHGVWTP
jgi:hypothetical protein